MTVAISQKAGVDGRLFGSVTNFDIADRAGKQGFPRSRRRWCGCPTAR
jgi:large subunit ribosomal protein L9